MVSRYSGMHPTYENRLPHQMKRPRRNSVAQQQDRGRCQTRRHGRQKPMERLP